MLLYARWREADAARADAENTLRAALTGLAQAESAAQKTQCAPAKRQEAKLDPLREESAVAGAVLQRLAVQRQSLDSDMERAQAQLRSLRARLGQLDQDITREAALNTDAHDTIAQLEDEQAKLQQAGEGAEARQQQADQRRDALARQLAEAEAQHSAATQERARLTAQAESAATALSEATRKLQMAEAAARQADAAQAAATADLDRMAQDLSQAETELRQAKIWPPAPKRHSPRPKPPVSTRRVPRPARAPPRSEAEGSLRSLRAEEAALAKLVARDTGPVAQLLDSLTVTSGYEQALGAALADDLRAPVADGGSGWVGLPEYGQSRPLAGAGRTAGPQCYRQRCFWRAGCRRWGS